MNFEMAPPHVVIWARRGILVAAAIQSFALMHGGLQQWTGFPW
jgi:hypothetical protein